MTFNWWMGYKPQSLYIQLYSDKPFKDMCSNEGKQTIICSSKRGPCFGGQGPYCRDISIDTNSNINKESYCDFGYSYQHPDYVIDTSKAENNLAGSYEFKSIEIEVFTLFCL